jgi:tetratricopeptide (TPR) repeat protein
MGRWLFVFFFVFASQVFAQNSSSPAEPASGNPQSQQAGPPSGGGQKSKQAKPNSPNLAPPRSDSVDASALDNGESSSKDTQIDLSPPADDASSHPKSNDILMDAEAGSGNPDLGEFHPWDPHKAAKDVEVGDYYFKRKNYRGAEDRYREALLYKNNDAVATFRLAVCLEKMDRPDDARQEYESYLKILPHGPQAEEAKKALDRLKGPAANAKP